MALAGMVSLAVAMGIGRFAFTPLLPLMLAEKAVDLQAASWLAGANYLAYLVGALLCTLQPWIWARAGRLPALAYSSIVRFGLAATGLVTAAMALPLPGAWPGLRFAAGIASALVLVFTSGWCLARLARLGAPALGGVIFAGPGVGIVLSGLLGTGMVAWGWTAASGWLVLGILAMVLTAAVWPVFCGGEERLAARPQPDGPGSAAASASAVAAGRRGRGEIALLALAYGISGFGYIITATFLPVIARQALPGSAWLDLFWPIFGTGMVVGSLLAMRVRIDGDLRYLLAASYGFQALGIGASLWSPTLTGFAVGSLMLGAPFTVITYFAMHEARRLRPIGAASLMGLLTSSFGIGQVLGPPLVSWLLTRGATPAEGFDASLRTAIAALLGGAALYLWMIRAYPISATVAPLQSDRAA